MKKFNFFSLLYLINILIGCQGVAPEPTLQREKLIDILVDVHIAEAAIANVYGSGRDSLAEVYYNQIYNIHRIDSTIFQEQITRLRKNPAYMKDLYEDVLTEVNRLDAPKNKKE